MRKVVGWIALIVVFALTTPDLTYAESAKGECRSNIFLYLDVSKSLTPAQQRALGAFLEKQEDKTVNGLLAIEKDITIIPFAGEVGSEVKVPPGRSTESLDSAIAQADKLDSKYSNIKRVLDSIQDKVKDLDLGPHFIFIIASDFQHDETPGDEEGTLEIDSIQWRQNFPSYRERLHDKLNSPKSPIFLLLPRPGRRTDLAGQVIRDLKTLVDYNNELDELASDRASAIDIQKFYKPISIYVESMSKTGNEVTITATAQNFSCFDLNDLTLEGHSIGGGSQIRETIRSLGPNQRKSIKNTFPIPPIGRGARREDSDVVFSIFSNHTSVGGRFTQAGVNIHPFIFIESLIIRPKPKSNKTILETQIRHNLLEGDPTSLTIKMLGVPLEYAEVTSVALDIDGRSGSTPFGDRHITLHSNDLKLGSSFWSTVSAKHDPVSLGLQFQATTPDQSFLSQEYPKTFDVGHFSDDNDSFEDLLRHASLPTLLAAWLSLLILYLRHDYSLDTIDVIIGGTAAAIFTLFFLAHKISKVNQWIDLTLYGLPSTVIGFLVLVAFSILGLMLWHRNILFPDRTRAQIRANLLFRAQSIRNQRTPPPTHYPWGVPTHIIVLRRAVYFLFLTTPLVIAICLALLKHSPGCYLSFTDSLKVT